MPENKKISAAIAGDLVPLGVMEFAADADKHSLVGTIAVKTEKRWTRGGLHARIAQCEGELAALRHIAAKLDELGIE